MELTGCFGTRKDYREPVEELLFRFLMGGRLGIQLRSDLKYKFFCAEEAQLSALLHRK